MVKVTVSIDEWMVRMVIHDGWLAWWLNLREHAQAPVTNLGASTKSGSWLAGLIYWVDTEPLHIIFSTGARTTSALRERSLGSVVKGSFKVGAP